MKRKLLAIKNCLSKFNKWFESFSEKGRLGCLIQILIGVCIFPLVIALLFTLALVAFYLPRVSMLLILICVAVPIGVIVLSPLMVFAEFISSGLLIKKMNAGVWKTAKFLSTVLFCFSILLMFFVFLLSCSTSMQTKICSNKTQFPLSSPDTIAVDKEGWIYLALPIHGRIQVYSSSGDFLHGWFVKSWGGPFDIWIEDGLLHVAITRTDKHIAMNLDGQILESSEIQSFEEWELLWEKASNLTRDGIGNSYSIQSPLWLTRIVKTSSDGKETVIIKDTFHLWLIKFPLPFGLIGLMGIIMSMILGGIIKKKVDSLQLVTDSDQLEQSHKPSENISG